VDIVPASPDKQPQRRKGLAQNLLGKHTKQNVLAPHVYVGLWWRIRRNTFWPLKVVVVVTPATAESQSNGKTGAASSCPANPLLVVKPHGRHIGHHDCEQGANIDSRFHRGRHAEQVDSVSEGDFLRVGKANVLKQPLPTPALALARLPRQLFTIEPEQWASVVR
jgi:hypothetical protein